MSRRPVNGRAVPASAPASREQGQPCSVPLPGSRMHRPLPAAPSDADTVGVAPARAQEGLVEWGGPFPLHHGGALDGVRVAWRLVGPETAPVVAVLGGISAH